MKKITKLFSLVLISLVAFGISSCTDKYEYEQATVPSSQVYFNKDQATTITVDKKSSSFDVNIYRVDTNGELTVPLTFTPGEGNIPFLHLQHSLMERTLLLSQSLTTQRNSYTVSTLVVQSLLEVRALTLLTV